jgi:hypothetical protein
VAIATETDQFTTPKTRLCDIGPVLSRSLVEMIESDASGDTPEAILFKRVGRNVLTSRLTKWAKRIRNEDAPVTFRPSVFGSIYRTVAAPVPVSFWFDAPTVYVHGYYMGTDKIDHFFQQGHRYYKLFMRKEAEGAGPAEAAAAAVAHGVKQESTYFGTRFSGVYSNSDLAANFAGMKFYLNLRHAVVIRGRLSPPLFEPTSRGWRLRAGLDLDRVLEPFLSDHLDESLNPSRYAFSRGSIRARIRDRCATWTSFYADRLDLVAKAEQSFAGKWFGEEYGHWLPPAVEVSIATECGELLHHRSLDGAVPSDPARIHKLGQTQVASSGDVVPAR